MKYIKEEVIGDVTSREIFEGKTIEEVVELKKAVEKTYKCGNAQINFVNNFANDKSVVR